MRKAFQFPNLQNRPGVRATLFSREFRDDGATEFPGLALIYDEKIEMGAGPPTEPSKVCTERLFVLIYS